MRLEGKGFSVVTFEAGNELCPLCFYLVIFYGQFAIHPNKSHMKIFIIKSKTGARKPRAPAPGTVLKN
jgi:hypothetical protein